MKIGIFGGTFDPPHLGHLILAAEALDQLKLDQILWVLTPTSPFKQQQYITPARHRKWMVEMATGCDHRFQLSTVDIDREPPHFAVDTVSLMKDLFIGDKLYYLMGLDSLNDLPAWNRPLEFVNLCDGIVVMVRQGEILNIPNLSQEIADVEHKLVILQTPVIEISGTDIRSRVKNGRQYKYFLQKEIYEYILENELYND